MTKNRTIKKQFWFNREEASMLQKKAKKACMTEARLIRMLLEGYNPPAAPDDRFYDAMDEMRKASERLEALSHATDDADRSLQYHNAAHELLRIQNDIEKKYLLPKESDFRWQ